MRAAGASDRERILAAAVSSLGMTPALSLLAKPAEREAVPGDAVVERGALERRDVVVALGHVRGVEALVVHSRIARLLGESG